MAFGGVGAGGGKRGPARHRAVSLRIDEDDDDELDDSKFLTVD